MLTFLPIIVIVDLRINTVERSIAFKAVECYTKVSGSTAATKFGAKLHFFLSVLNYKKAEFLFWWFMIV